MAQLLIKFMTLGLKQAAKPLAKRFEGYVLNHPTFQTRVLGVAQKLHDWEIRRSADLAATASADGAGGEGGKRVFVGKLSDEKALHLAANLVSETFLFAVGAAIVLFEYERARRKDVEKKIKEESFRKFVDEMHDRERKVWDVIVPDLQQQNARQMEIIEAMAQRIDDLEQHVADMEAAKSQAKFLGLFSLGGGR